MSVVVDDVEGTAGNRTQVASFRTTHSAIEIQSLPAGDVERGLVLVVW